MKYNLKKKNDCVFQFLTVVVSLSSDKNGTSVVVAIVEKFSWFVVLEVFWVEISRFVLLSLFSDEIVVTWNDPNLQYT